MHTVCSLFPLWFIPISFTLISNYDKFRVLSTLSHDYICKSVCICKIHSGLLFHYWLHNIFVSCVFRSKRREVFCKKGFPRSFTKVTGKRLCQSLLFNKVAGMRSATLFKKRVWHRCFPENFEKFLRTPFFIKHLWWLLLCFSRLAGAWPNQLTV